MGTKYLIRQLILTFLVLAGAAGAQPHFVDVTTNVGLGSYMASTGDGHGPGAVFTDLDNDTFPDLYVVRSGAPNELYHNIPGFVSGTRVFVREPNDGGAGDTGPATGAIAADYDNDGDTDLFVINFNGPNVLFQSQLAQGQGLIFQDETLNAGLGDITFQGVLLDNTLTAAWGDVDRDGDLDLYVGNHDGWCGNPIERPVPGQRDIFYRNNGNATFTEETVLWGLEGFEDDQGNGQLQGQWYSSTNAVVFADFDNDRWPDLLVTNKVGTGGGGCPKDRDMLYLNRGNSGGAWAGYQVATYSLPTPFGNKSNAAMGVDVGDPDNDGDLDIYISDFLSTSTPTVPGKADIWINTLAATGVLDFSHDDTTMPGKWGWGVDWFDMDNDGHQDMHTTTQLISGGIYWRDFAYAVRPSGQVLEVAAFLGVDQVRQARGNPHADYDKDGWVDLFVVNTDNAAGPSVLYENRLDQLFPQYHWLVLELEGRPNLPSRFRSSRDAIGARVEITADLDNDGMIEPGETQYREVVSGHGNAATSSSLAIEVGLRLATSATVKVRWPSGRVSTKTFAVDQCKTIKEPLDVAVEEPIQQPLSEP